MIREAIILGGSPYPLMQSGRLPKPLTAIGSKPYIEYLMIHLLKQGMNHFILCTSGENEIVSEYVLNAFPETMVDFISTKPFHGNGYTIKMASRLCRDKNILVISGNAYYEADIRSVSLFHEQSKADCTVCLKPVFNTDLYGTVEVDSEYWINGFRERQFNSVGLIDSGTYALNTENYQGLAINKEYSFENDYLRNYVSIYNFTGLVQDVYFADLDNPRDFARAIFEMQK